MNGVTVSPGLMQKTLQFVNVSSQCVKRAVDELQIHRGQQQKAAEFRGPLLDYLIDKGLVEPESKQAAEAMLGSHIDSLKLLKAAVDKLVAANDALAKTATQSLGKPGTEKSAGASSYDSLTDPFIGRRTSELKASDRALQRILE